MGVQLVLVQLVCWVVQLVRHYSSLAHSRRCPTRMFGFCFSSAMLLVLTRHYLPFRPRRDDLDGRARHIHGGLHENLRYRRERRPRGGLRAEKGLSRQWWAEAGRAETWRSSTSPWRPPHHGCVCVWRLGSASFCPAGWTLLHRPHVFVVGWLPMDGLRGIVWVVTTPVVMVGEEKSSKQKLYRKISGEEFQGGMFGFRRRDSRFKYVGETGPVFSLDERPSSDEAVERPSRDHRVTSSEHYPRIGEAGGATLLSYSRLFPGDNPRF